MQRLISENEQAERQQRVDFAKGNIQLEGLTLDAETEKIVQKYIIGEITADEQMSLMFSFIR